MKHIGIAGCTIPGGLLCIQTIVDESYKHFGAASMRHPLITYTNPPLDEQEVAFQAKDWEGVAKDLLASIQRLHAAGADFVIIPSNSVHYAIDIIKHHSPLPILSILDVAVEECIRLKYRKVGILGVGITMSGGLYEKPLHAAGISSVVPSKEDQDDLNDLIYHDIIQGNPTPMTKAKMLSHIQKLAAAGCDAFIAGCTEIPLLLSADFPTPIPCIDTTRLLAKRAFLESL